MIRISKYWTVGLVLLVSLGLLGVWAVFFQKPISPPKIPNPDLARVHPLVAEAINAVTAKLEDDELSIDHWAQLGRVFLAHDLNAEALTCFKYLWQREPMEARWIYYQGFIHEQNDPELAIREYLQTIELAPDYKAARLRLAKSLTRLGRLREAESELRRGMTDSQPSPYFEYELALVLLAQGEHTAARVLLEQAATRTNWYSRPASVALARLCFSQGDLECASAASQQVSRFPEATSAISDPWLTEIQKHSAMLATDAQTADSLMARGEFGLAMTVYQRLIEKRPELTRPRTNLAYCYAMSGRQSEAIRIAQENTRLFPNDSQVWYALGSFYEQAGQSKQAIDAYQKCLELAPLNAGAWLGLGFLQKQSGHPEEARIALEKAVTVDPRNAPGHLALGEVLKEREDWEGAIEHFEAAVALAPGDPIPLGKLNQAKAERRELDLR